MRVLIDTHVLLWWLAGDRRVPKRIRRLVGDEATSVFVSAASAWEITTKSRLGKLEEASEVARDVVGCIVGQGFVGLSVNLLHA